MPALLDDVVDARFLYDVLAHVVHTSGHQLDGVQRTDALLWRSGGVASFAEVFKFAESSQ